MGWFCSIRRAERAVGLPKGRADRLAVLGPVLRSRRPCCSANAGQAAPLASLVFDEAGPAVGLRSFTSSLPWSPPDAVSTPSLSLRAVPLAVTSVLLSSSMRVYCLGPSARWWQLRAIRRAVVWQRTRRQPEPMSVVPSILKAAPCSRGTMRADRDQIPMARRRGRASGESQGVRRAGARVAAGSWRWLGLDHLRGLHRSPPLVMRELVCCSMRGTAV